MNRQLRANLMLLTTAVIWGTAFVAQRAGMDYIGPLTFNGLRFMLGAIVLLPIIYVWDRSKAKNGTLPVLTREEKLKARKTLWKAGTLCGLALFAGTGLQQWGLVYTTAGKTGFITALYIVIVPIFGLFLGHKVRNLLWVSVVFGLAGLYLISINEGFSVNIGDVLAFGCAFGFAFHILVVDHYTAKVDPLRFSSVQFFVCASISLVLMVFLEHPAWEYIVAGAVPILYTGIMSCCVAYTFQIIAQKDTSPTVASLLLSMESVFAAIFGFLLLHEQLTVREMAGCLIVFLAIIMAQLPERKESQLS